MFLCELKVNTSGFPEGHFPPASYSLSRIYTIVLQVDDSCHCTIMGNSTWRMTFSAMCHLPVMLSVALSA